MHPCVHATFWALIGLILAWPPLLCPQGRMMLKVGGSRSALMLQAVSLQLRAPGTRIRICSSGPKPDPSTVGFNCFLY